MALDPNHVFRRERLGTRFALPVACPFSDESAKDVIAIHCTLGRPDRTGHCELLRGRRLGTSLLSDRHFLRILYRGSSYQEKEGEDEMFSLTRSSQCNSKTILIVDDDWTVQMLLSELIRHTLKEFKGDSPTIFVASSAEEAIVLFAENPIGLIISDYRLPRISGLELIRTVRFSTDMATGTVLMSSDYEILDRVSKREGVDAVLRKPVNRTALKKILGTFFLNTLEPSSG